jgi:hypothetical protein
LEVGAFVSVGAGVDLEVVGGGGGGVDPEPAGFSVSALAGESAALVESPVSTGGVVSAGAADFPESPESAGFASVDSVGSPDSAGFDSGAGVGVAFVFELEPFPDVDFLFAEVAGFRAESVLDLLVAACPLESSTNGSTTKPRIIRMYETLNIGGRK